METKGFVTRKMGRMEQERKNIEEYLLGADKYLESILEQAMRVAKLRQRWKRNLAKVNADIEKLFPRMKCEEVLVAKAMSLPGTDLSENF